MSKKDKTKLAGGVKKYSLSADEQTKIRRTMTTIGFFNTAVEGLKYVLEVEQRKIEERVKVGEAKPGYTMQTMIDTNTFELLAREVKIPEPEKKEKETK